MQLFSVTLAKAIYLFIFCIIAVNVAGVSYISDHLYLYKCLKKNVVVDVFFKNYIVISCTVCVLYIWMIRLNTGLIDLLTNFFTSGPYILS